MELFQILLDGRNTGRKITQVERIDNDKIEVSVGRTGSKGWDTILLQIVKE